MGWSSTDVKLRLILYLRKLITLKRLNPSLPPLFCFSKPFRSVSLIFFVHCTATHGKIVNFEMESQILRRRHIYHVATELCWQQYICKWDTWYCDLPSLELTAMKQCISSLKTVWKAPVFGGLQFEVFLVPIRSVFPSLAISFVAFWLTTEMDIGCQP